MKGDFEQQEWDVIVVGTGQGGASAGHALAKAGRSVLFLEKGRAHLDGAGALKGTWAETSFRAGDEEQNREVLARGGRRQEPLKDVSGARPHEFVPFIGCGTGGSSALYGMALERFAPEDFTPRSNFDDVGESSIPENWPVTFAQLRPFYEEAERLFGVHGTVDPLRADSPRLLPAPPPMNPANQELFNFFEGNGLHPYRLPMGCDYSAGSDQSQSFLDATGAKQDAARVFLTPALRDYGAELLDECEVLRLEATREAVHTVVCSRRRQTLRLRARQVVLAAGALATPGLLLNSASPQWPQGLANDSGLVGRNLMRHHIDLYVVSTRAEAPQGGNLKELAFNDLYSANGLKLGTVQSFGAPPPPEVICAELASKMPRWLTWAFRLVSPLLAFFLRRMFAGKVVIASIMEDLPHPENRVLLSEETDGLGRRRPAIRYQVLAQDARRTRLFREHLARLLRPYRFNLLKQAESNERIAHACGTCRFGTDPDESVLDPNCRAHGLSNLYVTDASYFPSSGGTNPGLTIAANGLRVAAQILEATKSDQDHRQVSV